MPSFNINKQQLCQTPLIRLNNLPIHPHFYNLLEYLKNPNREKHNINAPCYMSWYSPFITWDGYVSPCCICTDKQVVFGNVFEKPFREIWNSEEAREFRRQIKKKRAGICSTCGVEEYYIYNKINFLKR